MKCNKKIVFFLATHGYPEEFHVFKKNTPQTKIKSASAFKDLHTWLYSRKRARRERNV